MEFDILNQLLTSTVYDLFSRSQSISQSKLKVRDLQALQKQQNSKRNSSNDSRLSGVSQSSSRSASQTRQLPKVSSIQQWMKIEAPRRLKQSIGILGINQSYLRNRKTQLDNYVDSMSTQKLSMEKKKVKNQLRLYDTHFHQLFGSLPNHQQKQPFRPLYIYYKKLKQHLSKRGVHELSAEAIEKNMQNIKNQRRDLRDKIERYQKQFQQTNNRKIRYVRDITPIDYEYKRYKQLKVQLQKFQQMLKNQQDQ